MQWQVASSLMGAALAGAVFVYMASSPWLLWYTVPASAQTLLVFSEAVPRALVGEGAQYFTALPSRWRYVATHRSWPAWRATAAILVASPVPLHPAALLYTEQWFETPTIIMATSGGNSLRLLAQPLATFNQAIPERIRVPTTAHPPLSMAVPGAALSMVPWPLKGAWNDLIREHLGFTATKPDILKELAQYERVLINMSSESAAAVGISTPDAVAQQRWREMAESWVITEDRFRRPVKQVFRLPDGTRGREVAAGLPGAVWNNEPNGACRTPLPNKPQLWTCDHESLHILATYPWQPDTAKVALELPWHVILGSDFMASLPGISTLTAGGSDTRAAAVIELES